jgi:hypothetical protein
MVNVSSMKKIQITVVIVWSKRNFHVDLWIFIPGVCAISWFLYFFLIFFLTEIWITVVVWSCCLRFTYLTAPSECRYEEFHSFALLIFFPSLQHQGGAVLAQLLLPCQPYKAVDRVVVAGPGRRQSWLAPVARFQFRWRRQDWFVSRLFRLINRIK